MIDLALLLTNEGADLGFENNDLVAEEGLRTAVIISLLTDARVEPDELPESEDDPRGWWGDALEDTPDNTGSKCWLLDRETRTDEVLGRYEQYDKEALQWLIDDGVASEVTVAASYDDKGELVEVIEITRPNGQTSKFRFDAAWRAELLR
jgi:phage gp46-like protein